VNKEISIKYSAEGNDDLTMSLDSYGLVIGMGTNGDHFECIAFFTMEDARVLLADLQELFSKVEVIDG